ncbi:MAG: hypothetical protein O7G88_00975 [bacterium]|nr:hypothetical protein [bacterium]
MAQPSGDPVPSITEQEAAGAIKAIYEDIKAVIGVPVVNLIFRHMATLPGCLEWGWEVLRPLYAGGELSRVAEALITHLELPAIPRLLAPALRAVGVDAPGERMIARILDAYNRSNPMNMIALSTLLTYLAEGVSAATASHTDTPIRRPPLSLPSATTESAVLPPLLSLDTMQAETAVLVRTLNGLSPQGEARTMASMYRQLAHWPGYLALALVLLQPLHADGRLQVAVQQASTQALSQSQRMAQVLSVDVASAPPVGEVRQALDTALRYFTAHLIVEMIPVGRFLRHTLPEPLSVSGLSQGSALDQTEG